MQPVLIVIGTRPEGIKLIPVYNALKNAQVPVRICSTNQHDTLLKKVFALFNVFPDYEFDIMRPGQDLFYITTTVLSNMKDLLESVDPELVIVQGDTTTAMAAAMAAFYKQIPIAHVEAGLRTNDLTSPFPEEMNRRFISIVAAYHFAPTSAAAAHVLAQGVHRDAVFCTGNTVVDALYSIQEKIESGAVIVTQSVREAVADAKAKGHAVVLLTMHRRESFDGGIERTLSTIKKAVDRYLDMHIFFPYHPNPHVISAMKEADIFNHERITIFEALDYHDLVYLLTVSSWVMTDSGGIQEEATSLGKRTLVLRNHTERMEGVWAGLAHVVGTDPERIMEGIASMMTNTRVREVYSLKGQNVYGDGHAAEKIAQVIQQKLGALQLNGTMQQNIEGVV